MCIYEVTQAQWNAVMATKPWKGEVGAKEGADLPATHVSWHDAKAFSRTLSATGETYDLPTEAQWEFACRAGTTTAYHVGPQLTVRQANMGFFATPPLAGAVEGPTRVGQYAPNAWGLYDMHGNLSEWCRDSFREYGTATVTDPSGPADGPNRVFRGGHWAYGPETCRSAGRGGREPTFQDLAHGFRVVWVPK
jgi:formylglycine-generating enzyme required for sulfatase activity